MLDNNKRFEKLGSRYFHVPLISWTFTEWFSFNSSCSFFNFSWSRRRLSCFIYQLSSRKIDEYKKLWSTYSTIGWCWKMYHCIYSTIDRKMYPFWCQEHSLLKYKLYLGWSVWIKYEKSTNLKPLSKMTFFFLPKADGKYASWEKDV